MQTFLAKLVIESGLVQGRFGRYSLKEDLESGVVRLIGRVVGFALEEVMRRSQRSKLEVDGVRRGSYCVGFIDAATHRSQRLPLVFGLALLT